MVQQSRRMLTLTWVLVLCFVASGSEVSNSTDDNVTVTCEREHEYDTMDVRTVLGKWKAVELYLHLSKEGVKIYDRCPHVTIWETDEFPRTTFGVGPHLHAFLSFTYNKQTNVNKSWM